MRAKPQRYKIREESSRNKKLEGKGLEYRGMQANPFEVGVRGGREKRIDNKPGPYQLIAI